MVGGKKIKRSRLFQISVCIRKIYWDLPCSFVYLPSMAAFALEQQSLVARETSKSE